MGALTVVFDTNLYIGAMGWKSTSWQCLVAAFVTDVDLVGSEEILDEIQRVMQYDRLPFTPEEQSKYPKYVRYEMTVVEPRNNLNVISEDPDDDMFLEAAIEADAEYIVSNDDHLLDLDTFQGIDICTPAEFLAQDDTPSLG